MVYYLYLFLRAFEVSFSYSFIGDTMLICERPSQHLYLKFTVAHRIAVFIGLISINNIIINNK